MGAVCSGWGISSSVTVHLFLLRCERLEGRVLRCKPTLVTLWIDPGLAAFLGQPATDPLGPDENLSDREALDHPRRGSQFTTKSNPRGEENDRQDHRSDLQQYQFRL